MSPPDNGRLVRIAAATAAIEGMLELPAASLGVVLFAHGSGSGRLSPRNNFVAGELRRAGLGTLLLDLLTRDEDRDYNRRFDIELLSQRLADAARFLGTDAGTAGLPVGVFGASTGAAAALRLAAAEPDRVGAVVSRGGRPDLAGEAALARVRAPTLLIVGGDDHGVIELNEASYRRLDCVKQLSIVPGATHLFEEPGTLEEVAGLAAAWFRQHLGEAGAPETVRP
jgi:putative phosphoribosyl transferase